jgi:hypothetical protein
MVRHRNRWSSDHSTIRQYRYTRPIEPPSPVGRIVAHEDVLRARSPQPSFPWKGPIPLHTIHDSARKRMDQEDRLWPTAPVAWSRPIRATHELALGQTGEIGAHHAGYLRLGDPRSLCRLVSSRPKAAHGLPSLEHAARLALGSCAATCATSARTSDATVPRRASRRAHGVPDAIPIPPSSMVAVRVMSAARARVAA